MSAIFTRVIQQLGERYAERLTLFSVVLTCANFMSAEMHLPKTRQDLSRWKALGDYETQAFRGLQDFYRRLGARRFRNRSFRFTSRRFWIYRHRFSKALSIMALTNTPALLHSKLPTDRTEGDAA